MKAAVIFENGGPDVLRYEDVPDPDCPEGFVLVDVAAISIEGGDLLARAGSPPPATPHIVGYLCAGTVVETGAGVDSPAVGDKVVALNADGSHAERRAVPAATTWPVPDGLDPAAAACVPVAMGTAQECLFTAANLEQGQTVLVHAGAGGVGMAAASTWYWTPSAARTSWTASTRLPTGERSSASAWRAVAARESRPVRSGRRTTRSAGSTWAVPCSPSTRACIG